VVAHATKVESVPEVAPLDVPGLPPPPAPIVAAIVAPAVVGTLISLTPPAPPPPLLSPLAPPPPATIKAVTDVVLDFVAAKHPLAVLTWMTSAWVHV
jgi:hypothetical protein